MSRPDGLLERNSTMALQAYPRRVVALGRNPGWLAVLLVGISLVSLICGPAPLLAQDVLSQLDLRAVATGLDTPVAITHAPGDPDDRLFITLLDGRVMVLEDGAVLGQPFVDLRDRVFAGGEQGLLSIAFHPNFVENRFFYANYIDFGGNTVIARFRATADLRRGDATSELILLKIQQPFGNHNGGQLQFGPDGHLYTGMGDGGAGDDPQCNGQRTDTLLGKMLRLNVEAPGSPPEVWASGLRNPWRFSFDRQTGDLYIADVGQREREEVNFQAAGSAEAGRNYGWKIMEGTLCRGSQSGCPSPVPGCNAPAYTPPVLEYDHGGGRCSITGGYVYRGSAIEGLGGYYFYGDFCAGTVWAARRTGGQWTRRVLPFTAGNLRTFGEDAAGEIYLAAGTSVFRITGPAPPPPPPPPPLPSSPGVIEFAVGEGEALAFVEGENARVPVRRVGGSRGAVSVVFTSTEGTAWRGFDYAPPAGVLSWADGEMGEKEIVFNLRTDGLYEEVEVLTVLLENPTGGAVVADPGFLTVLIVDADPAPTVCVEDGLQLCLLNQRFVVRTEYRTAEGGTSGATLPLTSDSGTFFFFDPANIEVIIKMVDACAPPFDRFWVFAAGLTNVGVRLTVIDTLTGQVRGYDNPLGQAFQPIQDTEAFATCP
jgi:hypothetical protein